MNRRAPFRHQVTSAVDRGRELCRRADEMCCDLQLVEVVETGGHGRYYLKPGYRWTNYLWVEVVTLRTGVLVHGDCETVAFKYYSGPMPRGPLYWMGTYNWQYAEEKARIGGLLETEWDGDVARSAVLEWRREKLIDRDAARELFGCDNQHEFIESVYEHLECCDYLSAGDVTPWRVFAGQAVLRRLVKLLERRDFRTASRAWFQREAA